MGMNSIPAGKRVLVVDDSLTSRHYHMIILEQDGYWIDEAEDGMKALDMAGQYRYDLFLVDINMPRMDGISLIRALRREKIYRTVPIIIISTEKEACDIADGLASGANLYLVKPVRPEDLLINARMLVLYS